MRRVRLRPPLSAALMLFALLALASATTPTPLPTIAGARHVGPLVVVHGGVGSPPTVADGPQAAAASALQVLQRGGARLDAAIARTAVAENDPPFNAGTRANPPPRGKTNHMDPAPTTRDGRFA